MTPLRLSLTVILTWISLLGYLFDFFFLNLKAHGCKVCSFFFIYYLPRLYSLQWGLHFHFSSSSHVWIWLGVREACCTYDVEIHYFDEPVNINIFISTWNGFYLTAKFIFAEAHPVSQVCAQIPRGAQFGEDVLTCATALSLPQQNVYVLNHSLPINSLVKYSTLSRHNCLWETIPF